MARFKERRTARKGYTQTAEIRRLLRPYEERPSPGGLIRFNRLPVAVAHQILQAAPILASDKQNDAPTFAEFVALGQRYPGMMFTGYRVVPERVDERVTIEGFTHPQAVRVCMEALLRPTALYMTRAWWW